MTVLYLSHLIEDAALTSLLEAHPGIGIETIEFGIGENLDHMEQTTDRYEGRMGGWIRNRPFSIHGPFLDLNPGSYDSLIREATMTRFLQSYSCARALGADRILFHTGFSPDTCFETGWPDMAAEFWKRFLEHTDGSIQIHLENVLDLHWETVASILDRVGCPYFTACLDAGHAHVYSPQTPLEWLEGLGSSIGHLHLHDNIGDLDSHLALGKGNIPLRPLFEKIRLCCPDASITLENPEQEALEESLSVLSRFL